jgi:NifU-like protein involved in Fe-S cluster formation
MMSAVKSPNLINERELYKQLTDSKDLRCALSANFAVYFIIWVIMMRFQVLLRMDFKGKPLPDVCKNKICYVLFDAIASLSASESDEAYKRKIDYLQQEYTGQLSPYLVKTESEHYRYEDRCQFSFNQKRGTVTKVCGILARYTRADLFDCDYSSLATYISSHTNLKGSVKTIRNHGPAPIPEEGKWVKAKDIKDISGYTHGVGWCAPQQGACKLSLNIKDGIIQECLIETIGCTGMTHSAAMASEILPGKTILEALNTDLVCDAINTAMRELFLQIVYGRSPERFLRRRTRYRCRS